MPLDITQLEIIPLKVPHGHRSKTIAKCRVTLNEGIVIRCRIKEGKKGIYVLWTGAVFPTKEARKHLDNRVLATYVINHCVADYTV